MVESGTVPSGNLSTASHLRLSGISSIHVQVGLVNSESAQTGQVTGRPTHLVRACVLAYFPLL